MTENRPIGFLGPVPVRVAIHGGVPPGDGSDLYVFFPAYLSEQFFQIHKERGWFGISSVREEVEIDGDILGEDVEESQKMVRVRVHSARSYKSHEVDPSILLRLLQYAFVLWKPLECSGLKQFIDPDDALREDPSASDGQVPDFGISHLSLGNSDSESGGSEFRVERGEELVKGGGFCLHYSIFFRGCGIDPEPVEDDESGFLHSSFLR